MFEGEAAEELEGPEMEKKQREISKLCVCVCVCVCVCRVREKEKVREE